MKPLYAFLPSVHLFTSLDLSRTRLENALKQAGFNPAQGFSPTVCSHTSSAFVTERPESIEGSLVICDEESFGSAQRWLQEFPEDLSSLYLILLADLEPNSEELSDRSIGLRNGLPHFYQQVSILSWKASEEDIARESATLVERHRSNPTGALLWIIDDDPARFGKDGCWAHLISVAKSSAQTRERLRVVRSVISEELISGATNRSALVSQWRRDILVPLSERGTRLVLVTDNQFSERDTHLGEAWAATVAQYVSNAEVFVASLFDINLVRPDRVQGIWIGHNLRLREEDTRRILEALAGSSNRTTQSPTSRRPESRLSFDRVRSIALSSSVFRTVWPELLSLSNSAILVSIHYCLLAAPEVSKDQLSELWRVLDWDEQLSTLFASNPEPSLEKWLASLPAERRAEAGLAWRAVLGPQSINARAVHKPAPLAQSLQLSFLAVIGEWSSHHGGLTTFNRELCIALAAVGHRVQCLVTQATEAEILDAEQQDVLLIPSPTETGAPKEVGLFMPPSVPFKPDFVIGHGRITGPAARRQTSNYFKSARRVHFLHMSPEEIERYKGFGKEEERDAARIASDRIEQEIELSRDAALVVGVGPRLYREIATQVMALRPRPTVHRLDPGLPRFEREKRLLPPSIFCLIAGRVDDYHLKGVDLAARAIGELSRDARTRYGTEIELVVRGVQPGHWKKCEELLKEDGGAHLQFRIRNFSTDPQNLMSDFLQSSVVLMPSKAEGFGLIGLEAIAAGTPVLVSQRSGLADLLIELQVDANVVVPTTGRTEVDVDAWKKAIDLILVDRVSAFERAAILREQLTSTCNWEYAARRLVERLASAAM